jgi:hypothetical protein
MHIDTQRPLHSLKRRSVSKPSASPLAVGAAKDCFFQLRCVLRDFDCMKYAETPRRIVQMLLQALQKTIFYGICFYS